MWKSQVSIAGTEVASNVRTICVCVLPCVGTVLAVTAYSFQGILLNA